MKKVLIIKSLSKSYDEKEVLQNVNLEIPAGNIFGLIGPNGAGKSTLIGILTGLLDYEEGQIIFGDLPLIPKNEEEIKKSVSSVLQPPLLFENFTSFEFITYVCEMYDVAEKSMNDKITSLFSYFEIGDFTHIKVRQLSSGSRKKLAFCAAILTKPKILFLDEPFESVDVISIGRMKAVLRQIRDKGTTIFLTSHILEVVENLCDDIAILSHGNIIAYLDAESRRQLQRDSSLSEIFDEYVKSGTGNNENLTWL